MKKAICLSLLVLAPSFSFAAVGEIELMMSVRRLAGVMGVNMLPEQRLLVYEGTTRDGKACAVQAEIFGGKKTLNGVGVTVGLVSKKTETGIEVDQAVSFLLSKASTQSIYENTGFSKTSMVTTYKNYEMSEPQTQTLDITTQSGLNYVTVTAGGETLDCGGFVLQSDSVE